MNVCTPAKRGSSKPETGRNDVGIGTPVQDVVPRATGKPVAGFSIEEHGDLEIAAVAGRKAQEFVQWATELQREEVPLSDLWIATKCGESDTTSGLGSNPTVGNMFDAPLAEICRRY